MEKKGNDPTENLKKKPRKSILKSSSSFEVQEQPSGSKRKPLPLQNKLTKFDEQNIKETLHPPNKDYGHMKIEEPKTPFERPIQDEIDSPRGVDAGLLAQKLQQTQQKKKTRGSSGRAGTSRNPNHSDSSGDEMTPDKLAKKKEFESRRKAHYNEFLAAKEALKNLKDEEEEE